jgi:hypothetical protein
VMCLPMVRVLHRSSRVAMREAHPGALASEAGVWEGSSAIQAVAAKRVAVNTREGAHLGIGVHVLVRTQVGALGLAMRREAMLVEGRADARPGAEGPDLRRHVASAADSGGVWRISCEAGRAAIVVVAVRRRRRTGRGETRRGSEDGPRRERVVG